MKKLSLIALLPLLASCVVAHAQTVGLTGMMGGRALIVVDGGVPKMVAVGSTYQGVKVVSTQGDEAVVEVGGKRQTLRVGDAPFSSGGGGDGGGKIVLTAGPGGHFMTSGQINGKTVQFMVDTGATTVALSSADADRMGLNYKNGQATQVSTANGVIPAWRVRLSSVRIGEVVAHEVEALVSYGQMPFVLLGNSFLSRFQMTRTNDQLVLTKTN